MGIQSFGPAKSAVRATLFTDKTDKYLGNDAGYHTISHGLSGGDNNTGTLYVNNAEIPITANADSAVARNLSANSRVEYFPQMVSGNAGTSSNLQCSAYGNSKYIAGKLDGYSVASSDGTTWMLAKYPYVEPIKGSTYNAGLYVAVGGSNGSTGLIATSTDLINWTKRTIPAASSTYAGVAFANGLYVATNYNNANIATSPDGITWTARTAANSNANPVYGAGGWLQATTFNSMHYSTNGTTWTARTQTISTNPVYATEYGNGVYVVAGYNGTLASATTPGGTWTARTSQFGTSEIRSLAYGAGVFVAVGQLGKVSTSTDGTTWTLRTSGTTDFLQNVSFINNHFLARSINGVVIYSTDGITWTTKASAPGSGDSGIQDSNTLYVNGEYIFMANDIIAKSTDLNSWSRFGNTNTYAPQQMFLKDGLFYTITQYAQISTSPDGIWWKHFVDAHNNNSYMVECLAISYGTTPAKWMISGLDTSNYNAIATSTDLITWTNRVFPFGSSNTSKLVVGSNSSIAIVGSSRWLYYGTWYGTDGLISTSTDLVTWTARTSPTGRGIKGIAFGNGTFVMAAGGDPDASSYATEIYTSSDGITWTQRTSPNSTVNVYRLEFLNGQFVLSQGGGFISTSVDGITWKRKVSNTSASIRTVSSTETSLIGFGDSGTFIKENPTPPAAVMLTNNYGQATTLV